MNTHTSPLRNPRDVLGHDHLPQGLAHSIRRLSRHAFTTGTFLLLAACSSGSGNSTNPTVPPVNVTPAPTVSLAVSPTTVKSGAAATLTWSATDSTACTASGGWNGTEPASGSLSTGPLTTALTYTLSCTGAGGTTSKSATVAVTAPTPAPTVTLSASPARINAGASATLTWSSTDATACTASGGWSGNEPTGGSQSTGNLTASATYTLTCTGAGGSVSQSTTVSVTSLVSTVPNVTSLPANFPGPDTAGYTALNIPSQPAGYSWKDTVTGVKTWKLTAAGTPNSDSFFPWYSSGGLEISLAWGPNQDQYHIAFIDSHGRGYVCDFGLSSSATPGPYNFRALPTGEMQSYSALESAFSRIHPDIMYVLTGSGRMRLYNVATGAFVDSQAASYGFSSAWPATGWPWTGVTGWVTVNGTESWAFGNTPSAMYALNLKNGTQLTWTPSRVDDTYGGFADSVTGDQQSQVWLPDTNSQVAITPSLTAAGGWLDGQTTSHGASLRGYFVYFNTDGRSVAPMPAAVIDQTTGNAVFGTQSSPPYAAKYWGEFHLSGHWWLQSAGTDQYLLQSNFGAPGSVPGSATEQYALSFVNVGAGTEYRLGFSYSDYNSIGSISNYYTQPHATISHDGKLVIFGSDMMGTSRIDVFAMEVPLTTGTPPSYP